MSQEIAKNLAKVLQTFNDKRVVTEEEMQGAMQAIATILSENKKGIEGYSAELEGQLRNIQKEHESVLFKVTSDLTKTKAEVEKATKEQNDRAFKRLQELISQIKLPKDGRDGKDGIGIEGPAGKDGSPDTPEQVRDKLETLKDEDRLDASAIKNLPQFIKEKTKQLAVGGIRFLENLADVSVPIAKKREDLLIQYDTTNKRWQDGVALTVGTTAPTSPEVNDVWIDTN